MVKDRKTEIIKVLNSLIWFKRGGEVRGESIGVDAHGIDISIGWVDFYVSYEIHGFG